MSEAKQELRPPLGSMWCRWQPLKEVEGCSVWVRGGILVASHWLPGLGDGIELYVLEIHTQISSEAAGQALADFGFDIDRTRKVLTGEGRSHADRVYAQTLDPDQDIDQAGEGS